MEWLEILKAAGGAGGAVGIYPLILWLTGNLVSKREHLETRQDRDTLRVENKELQAVVRELVRQNAELLASGRVSVEAAKALTRVIESERAPDGLAP